MSFRSDAGLTAAEVVVEVDRLTRAAGEEVVGTIGELDLEPGLINVICGRARMSLDLRSASGAHVGVADATAAFARERAATRGQSVSYAVRREVEPTPMDPRIVGALADAAQRRGPPWRRMGSGAAHDTMNVARRVPSAMLFLPCREGISHAPDEHAEPADAALGAHVVLEAVVKLMTGDEALEARHPPAAPERPTHGTSPPRSPR